LATRKDHNAAPRRKKPGRSSFKSLSAFGWAPCGFAAIPTAALDPPHSTASPAVPALIGSGSPSGCLLHFSNFLKFLEQTGVKLREVPNDPDVVEQRGDVSGGKHQIEVIGRPAKSRHIRATLRLSSPAWFAQP